MKKTDNDLKILRHSAAHLVAHAVLELYPDTKLTIGPATEEGFFYDFLPKQTFKEEDLPKIEERMLEIANRNYPITHREISKEEARKLYHNNPFKLELIDGIEGDTVGLSCQGDFCDLCRGGHVESTGQLKHVKLLAVAGSYWRADRTKQALQRIIGTAFFTEKELNDFLTQREEAAKYDHRKIGKQLDLFSFHEEGPGFPFFHPRGKKVLNILVNYMRHLHDKYNYQEVSTPTMLSDELWKRSGHYAHYKNNMYFCTIDERNFAIKPMNCPGSILIYKSRPRSYRELPLKLAEFGHVHRHELSGVLHGLLRVRAFTQDDAHIYCTVNQIEQEVTTLIKIIKDLLKVFGFDNIQIALSTRPENAMGSQELWNTATAALSDALKNAKCEFTIAEGEGAFYGPKIEFVIQDSMGRSWTCGTIQVDFMNPENFDLTYTSSAGTKERPVMIHQAIYGSLERFFAILLEHFKGQLPFWLSPTQIRILTISDSQNEYAKKIEAILKENGLRVEIDDSSDQINSKIKNAQLEKIPWMIVLGQKEADAQTVSVRYLDGKQKMGIKIEELVDQANKLKVF
ncbi:threonine--tRNA ligase [Candidatus Dependentiae bacterium]|nr:threonine--tRNA ligase [Candidatus Dependentiae bacterium]